MVYLFLLTWGGALSARAEWSPPEWSITPPAVVTLDAFTAPFTNGAIPVAALVAGAEGALYGSAAYGGTNEYFGTLFRLGSNGTFAKLVDFNLTNGYGPESPMVMGPDGALYGTTRSGGTNLDLFGPGLGFGTLFRLEPDGHFTKLHDFNWYDGSWPTTLQLGPDNAFYGTTRFGGQGAGTLFRLETNGNLTHLHDFTRPDGVSVSDALTLGPDGAFYGSTSGGGEQDAGTLFRLQTNGTVTKLHDFEVTDGRFPSVPLVVGADGALYGLTQSGGVLGNGTLFRQGIDGSFAKLHDFSQADGAISSAAMVLGPDGALYGSTQIGGANGYGTLFRLEAGGGFVKLHDFNGLDGSGPQYALSLGPDGAFYGVTPYGGTSGNGTLFRLETNGIFAKLHDFGGSDGSAPFATLVTGHDLNLYGSAPGGGAGQSGILFKLVLQRTYTSPEELIHQLIALVNAEAARPQPLTATLSAALAALGRGQTYVAINQLKAFQNKVRAQVMRSAPALAQELDAAAQDLCDRLQP